MLRGRQPGADEELRHARSQGEEELADPLSLAHAGLECLKVLQAVGVRIEEMEHREQIVLGVHMRDFMPRRLTSA